MKKLIAALLCVCLTACGGGYDDMDAARAGMGGIGNTPSSPTPTNPDARSAWEYSQVGTSRFAEMRSLNTIPTVNTRNDAMMMVKIHNYIGLDGVARDYLTITVLFADTDCLVNCQLRYKKNGSTSGVYRVRQSVNGVFGESSFAAGDMDRLIKAIKTSSKASITVPLIGVPDAEFEFDFSGYDSSRMDAGR